MWRVVSGDALAFSNHESVELKVTNRSCPGSHISEQDMRAREIAADIVATFNSKNLIPKKAYMRTGLLVEITKNSPL